eukprot:gene16186-biopygen13129
MWGLLSTSQQGGLATRGGRGGARAQTPRHGAGQGAGRGQGETLPRHGEGGRGQEDVPVSVLEQLQCLDQLRQSNWLN